LNLIDKQITKIKKEKHTLIIKYNVEDKTEPFQANTSSPLVRSLVLSILDIRKKRPLLLKKTGTGDMNILGNRFNIPVVTYGPGDPHSSHSENERILINDYLIGIEIYKSTLYNILRLHKSLTL
jgi:LysW-gamma-L-lysine carboxypeptidase